MLTLFDSAYVVNRSAFASGLTGPSIYRKGAQPTRRAAQRIRRERVANYEAFGLSELEVRHIDAYRLRVYREACQTMPEDAARETAGDAAEREHDRLLLLARLRKEAALEGRLRAAQMDAREIALQAANRRREQRATEGGYRKPYTAADVEAWAVESNRNARDYDVIGVAVAAVMWDERAEEARAEELVEAGVCG